MEWLADGFLVAVTLVALATMGYWWFMANQMVPKELGRRFRRVAPAFAKAVELRQPGVRLRTGEVALLSAEIGRVLGLGPRALERLETLAYVREIGLCAAPMGAAMEEPALRRRYASGGAMLELVPAFRHLAQSVRNLDPELNHGGSVNVGMEPKIVRVAGDYLGHVGQGGVPHALAVIRAESGRRYDLQVVEALEQVLTFGGERVHGRILEPVSDPSV